MSSVLDDKNRKTLLKDVKGEPIGVIRTGYNENRNLAREYGEETFYKPDKTYLISTEGGDTAKGWKADMAENREEKDKLFKKSGSDVAVYGVKVAEDDRRLPKSIAYRDFDSTMPKKPQTPVAQPTAAVLAATKEGAPAKETSTPAAQAPAVKEEVPATAPTPAAVATEAASQKEETPAAQTAVEDVQQNEDGGKKTILWPDRPEMEMGNYVEQTDAQIAQALKTAAEQERRAKRDRDMAILSDIANLVTKGAAMHGGAWKIDKEEARSAVANNRLRALRDSNSKQLAEYARLRMAAQDAQRKERNAEKKAVYDAAVDKAKWEADVDYRDARLKEVTSYHDALLGIQGAREERLKHQGGGSGSGKEKNLRYLGDWAFNWDSPAEVDEAYAIMVQADQSKAVKEEPSLLYPEGKLVDNPSTAQKRDALIKGGVTKEAPKRGNNRAKTNGTTTASPLNKGKNSNNKKDTGSW